MRTLEEIAEAAAASDSDATEEELRSALWAAMLAKAYATSLIEEIVRLCPDEGALKDCCTETLSEIAKINQTDVAKLKAQFVRAVGKCLVEAAEGFER